MDGIWGLQASVANKLDNIGRREFRDAMQLAAARVAREEDLEHAVIESVIACMRYANALGISVDALAGEKIEEMQRGEM